ncbi:hypothetical protein WJX81_007255 [Elliptochloris bilobata]|uniref:Homoserine dehydrogenase n=1 Tax=Elliptochloris bilobata TaxID=381761 RepID=A0AAW1QYE2_9CHLO
MAARRLNIGLIGPGLVGKALLTQISQQADALRSEHGIVLCVLGIANSRAMLLQKMLPIDLSTWQEELSSRGTPVDLYSFAQNFQRTKPGQAVCMVDCTASQAVPALYKRWLAQGFHVVTPNKRLGSGPLADFRAAMAETRSGRSMFFGEATVGAGLPVLSTLQTLLATGDRVQRIEGVLSGTLSYLFNVFTPGQRFSELVADARRRGFTEPDPRDDLSGMDVARKAVILARQCGVEVELVDVELESLVPSPLRGAASADEFLERLPEFDAGFEERVQDAAAKGCVLRYVAAIDVAAGACTVSLQAVPGSHAFAQLSSSDNIIAFTTARYHQQPLVIRGPGAGAEVTAAGVFGDVVQLARCLGPPGSGGM